MQKLPTSKISRPSPEQISKLPRHPLAVVLDNIRSIYNVGSIFRTSDAVRAEKLYLTGITGTPEHKHLHKTALGAQDTVPWTYREDAAELVEQLRHDGYTIAALEITDRPVRLEDITLDNFPLCLVLGNEVSGVQQSLMAQADMALELPQYGAKHSFNVAVAYGIAAFHLVQQYRRRLKIEEGLRPVNSK